MNIVVCIKQVPSHMKVKLDPTDNTVIREEVPGIINPDDKSGIEVALRLKYAIQGSKVTAISMGPENAKKALREALAMGVDEAILLSDIAFAGSDTFATSAVLASAIRKLKYDVIIAGRHTTDGETAQVGPELAEHLGIPQITHCKDVYFENESLIAERQFEDRIHVIKAQTPCLFTVMSEKIVPRYMSVMGVFDSFKKIEDDQGQTNDRIKVWNISNLGDEINSSSIGIDGSPTEVKKIFDNSIKKHGIKKQNISAENAADEILNVLIDKGFI